jgi:pre-mRNA-splicing factor 38B
VFERGTRKTAGMSQTGMCGGVRGVSAGGVVSSAFCLLFKLHTIRPTKKQIYMMLNHCDSPYIRGIGFMYMRYTLPPMDMWKWFEGWLDDQEMIDIKAGGGKNMTMGEFCRLLLTKMEFFETRFPRIAVAAEKQIREHMDEKFRQIRASLTAARESSTRESATKDETRKSRGRSRSRSKDKSNSKKRSKSRSRSKHKKRSRSRDRKRSRDRDRKRSKDRRSRSRSKNKKSKKEKKSKRSRSQSRDRRRSKDRNDKKSRDRDGSYSDELRKYKDLKKSRRSRSRS